MNCTLLKALALFKKSDLLSSSGCKYKLWYISTLSLLVTIITHHLVYRILLGLQQVTAPALFSETSNIEYNSQTLTSTAALENVTEYDNI